MICPLPALWEAAAVPQKFRWVDSPLNTEGQATGTRDLGNSSVQFILLSGEELTAMEMGGLIGDLHAFPEESSSLPASWELIVCGA